jgi:alpha-1,2-mannosyltransferase
LGLVVFGVVNLAVGSRTSIVQSGSSGDFDLNWIAARRLVDGEPLYDHVASRAEAVKLLGPWMTAAYRDPFLSYIGPPPTALLHTPFLLVDHDTAAELFGIAAAVGMALSVVITAHALPRPSRLPASLLGIGALLVSFPALRTLELGQGNEFVMLGLAVGVWGASRKRWGLAGVGLGVAAVLKISPVLLVVYLGLRGQWRAARSAVLTALTLFGLAAVVGRPDDLIVWLRKVAPSISAGPIHVYNQSLVAWLQRVTTNPAAFGSHTSLGPEHFLAYIIAGAGTLALWSARRRSSLQPLELGVLILLMLVAGPLSWDHYFVWTVIPITLMVDLDLWRGRSRREVVTLVGATSAAVLLLFHPVTVPSTPPGPLGWALLRIMTAPYTIAALILLAVASRLLLRPNLTTTEPFAHRTAPQEHTPLAKRPVRNPAR